MTRSLNVVFAGTPDFSVPSVTALHQWCTQHNHRLVGVFTQPDRPAGRGRALRQSPVKQWAVEHGLDVFQPSSFKQADSFEALEALQADLMVVVAYGLLLPKPVLGTPTLGCINVHASLLPRWRGAAPIQRAIAAGDAFSGVCIMQMDEGLDTGPIWSTAKIKLGTDETGGSLHDRLAQLGASSLVETLEQIATASSAPNAQASEGVTYAHKLSKQEARIDWAQSAVHIERTIRAFNPWPVAHTMLEGRGLRIFEAAVLQRPSVGQSGPKPGTIIDTDEQLLVATGEGVLKINTLQTAGGRVMTATALLNAHDCLHKTLGESTENE